jgi:CCS family citrate carrier protein
MKKPKPSSKTRKPAAKKPAAASAAKSTAVAAKPAAAAVPQGIWHQRWANLCDINIGVIPLPIYLILGVLIAVFTITGHIPTEINMMIAVMAFFGSTCAELGKRMPIIRNIGGTVILATFIPSYMVYKDLIPTELLDPVVHFTESTKFIYLFISCIIVGSILGMERNVLIRGFLRIFVPLAVGSVLAAVAGTLTGVLLGIGAEKTFFYIVVPIMAGGVGEGAIPLSIGYSEILGQDQGGLFAEILPVVMLGSLTAIILAGMLNSLGRKYPHLTGKGNLTIDGHDDLEISPREQHDFIFDAAGFAASALMAIMLYLMGVLCHQLFGLPAPVAMLFLAVVAKLTHAVPRKYENNAYMVYRFFSVGITYPLLFAIGVSMTPWEKLVAAFNAPYLITIVVTVVTLVATGFFMGRRLNMYPIECAIVNACHSGQGGTGDIAILTAANRMVLMPFAQIATRIGGAITVTLAIIALGYIY